MQALNVYYDKKNNSEGREGGTNRNQQLVPTYTFQLTLIQ